MWKIVAVLIAAVAVALNRYRNEITQLIIVGSGFTAQTVCSGVFVSGFSVKTLVDYEISGIAATVFGFEVDYEKKRVDAYILRPLTSLFLPPLARSVFIDSHLGCRLLVPPDVPSALPTVSTLTQRSKITARSDQKEDNGIAIDIFPALQQYLDAEVSQAGLKLNHTRGVVVMHHGKIVGEAYQNLIGVNAMTPMLGWSMTKSVHAAVFAAAVQDGVVQLDASTSVVVDAQRGLNATFRDLLTMADVLDFNEDYSMLADCAEMLFRSGDCATFAMNSRQGRLKLADKLKDKSADVDLSWYYSSGTSNVLSKELRRHFASTEEYWRFPFSRLLDRIGANSFALETDASGTFVASSFSYATARHWARLGQLYLQQGVWEGERVLDEEVVALASKPRKNSGGHYGGSFWLNPAGVDVVTYNELPADHPKRIQLHWLARAVPKDAYFMSGFNGQFTIIIPSLSLVVARLGFTPDTKNKQLETFDKGLFFSTIIDLVRQIKR